MLLITPRFDYVTKFSCAWADEIIVSKNERLNGEDAIRKVFEEAVKKHNIIVFYSHGNKNSIIGNDKNPILDRSNAYLLKDKMVFAMACLTANKLGKIAPAQRYLGFNDEFSFTIHNHNKFGTFVNNITNTFVNNEKYQYAYITYILRKALDDVQYSDITTKLCMKKDVKGFRYIENNSGIKSNFIIEGVYE